MRPGRHDSKSDGARRPLWLVALVATLSVMAVAATAALLVPWTGSDTEVGSAEDADVPTSVTSTLPASPDVTTTPAPTSMPTTLAPLATDVGPTDPWQATSREPGRVGVEAAALSLVKTYRLLPTDASAATLCSESDTVVTYTEPDFHFTLGAYAPPLGPVPDMETSAVNGVVICRASEYAVMGFEATWSDATGWTVIPVPAVD